MLHRLACLLDAAESAFKKLDSLLRGHIAAEIAACLAGFHHCVIAPGLPVPGPHRPATGVKWRAGGLTGGASSARDLAGSLRRLKASRIACRPGDAAPAGVSLWDAETDDDLAAVVAAAAGLPGRVLWCGSGGLAGALAANAPVPSPALLPTPILALVGSDHAASVAQLSAAWKQVLRIARGSPDEAASIARRLTAPTPPSPSCCRPESNAPPAPATSKLPRRSAGHPRPSRHLVLSAAARRSAASATRSAPKAWRWTAKLVPGVPASVMLGGRWDGLRVLSKSGAFGDSGLLLRLLAPNRDARSGMIRRTCY